MGLFASFVQAPETNAHGVDPETVGWCSWFGNASR